MNIRKIYFDMDGVLADFDKGVLEFCHLSPISQSEKTEAQDVEMWNAIRQVEHFYDKLKPMPRAIEMFRIIYEKYGDRCEILTGIPKKKRGVVTAGEDKITWAHRILTPDIVVNIVYAEDKKNFCTGSDCVLIDDMSKNIDAWVSSGGIGVLFESFDLTMKLLREKGIV